jgi:hypothetical protein
VVPEPIGTGVDGQTLRHRPCERSLHIANGEAAPFSLDENPASDGRGAVDLVRYPTAVCCCRKSMEEEPLHLADDWHHEGLKMLKEEIAHGSSRYWNGR